MKTAILAAFGALFATTALASSDDAWEEFRVKVKESCAALVDDATAEIEVNPFGSESYGVALITVTHDDETQERMACIFDKQKETAEITGPFTE